MPNFGPPPEPLPEGEILLTPREYAKIHGVTRRLVQYRIESGEVFAYLGRDGPGRTKRYLIPVARNFRYQPFLRRSVRKGDDLFMLDAAEVAQLLQMTPDTVKQWARRGLLPCVKCGRMWRFSVSGIRRMIAERNLRRIGGRDLGKTMTKVEESRLMVEYARNRLADLLDVEAEQRRLAALSRLEETRLAPPSAVSCTSAGEASGRQPELPSEADAVPLAPSDGDGCRP